MSKSRVPKGNSPSWAQTFLPAGVTGDALPIPFLMCRRTCALAGQAQNGLNRKNAAAWPER